MFFRSRSSAGVLERGTALPHLVLRICAGGGGALARSFDRLDMIVQPAQVIRSDRDHMVRKIKI
jgi:hypothetical protein